MHRVDHTKEVRVDLAQSDQVLARELASQISEHLRAWQYFSTLGLGWSEAEALRCLLGHLNIWLPLQVPFDQECEASRDRLLKEDLLLYEGENSEQAQSW